MNSPNPITEPIILLQTKLYHPQTRQDCVSRPHLIDHLNQHLTRKLTLITAPVGYGKTTIATQWLAQLDEVQHQGASPVAWLSLDEYDDDLLLFLRYLVAAVQTAYADFGEDILAAIHSTQPPPWRQLALILANDFAHLAQPLILTLDDYHVITEETIHQLINRLLEHLPPSLHLVLLSRIEPPLALGRLRARRQTIELRAADLTFSLIETTQLMTQALGKTPQPETLQMIHSGSEGWIAGLQLATLSLPHRADDTHQLDETGLLRHFQGHNPHSTDYLFEEVLALQPPSVQEFLLKTAILDRFCTPLCQAILGETWLNQMAQDEQLPETIRLGQTPTQMLLGWLGRANLFLIPLDNEAVWYRYHHLFQKMLAQTLQERVSAIEIATLHRKASAWLTDEGVIEPAIQHALLAEDTVLAAELIEQQRYHLLSRFDFITMDRWLAWLPAEIVAQRPALLIIQGWRNYHFQARQTVLKLAEQAANILGSPELTLDAEATQRLSGEINLLTATGLSGRDHLQQMLNCTQLALSQVPQDYSMPYPYAHLLFMNAQALYECGQADKAFSFLDTTLNAMQKSTGDQSLLKALFNILHFWDGHLQQSMQGFQRLLDEEVLYKRSAFFRSWFHCYLGSIYYEWNQLELAYNHLTLVADVSKGTSIAAFRYNLIMQALVYQAQAQPTKAWQVLARFNELNITKNDDFRLNDFYAFEANLHLRQGTLAQAWQRFQLVKPTLYFLADLTVGVPQLTQVQLLIAQGNSTDLQQAKQILQDLKSTVGPNHHRARHIKILGLEALVHRAEGQSDQALTILERAITLAKPDGFIRTFVDLGESMASLMYQLLARDVETDYLGQILAAFPQALQNDTPAQQAQQAAQAQLIEPLTERESEILLHLNEGSSNKVIARNLDISPLTVKKHTINIYQKLSVNGRKKAVARAKALGILPAD